MEDHSATFDIMLGSYPHTQALKSGDVRSGLLALNFANVASASTAFRRVVALEFDVAELSVITYIIARSRGVPLVMLPADLFRRAKQPDLLYDASLGIRGPRDMAGTRIGVAYYTATTSVWMQVMLANAGVDVGSIRWVAVEGPHVSTYDDPSTVERAPAGKSLLDLLRSGDVDAIVTTAPSDDARFKTVVFGKAGRITTMQSHHMVVVKQELRAPSTDAVRELWRMLLAAKAAAQVPDAVDPLPYGFGANWDHLAAAIEASFRLGFIPEKIPVEALFDDITISLPPSA